MAAAAYKGTLKFVYTGSGRPDQVTFTASDVNGQYYTFQDGNTFLQLQNNEGDVLLSDVILSAAGTDTTTASVYANQKSTPVLIMNASNVGTVINRQFAGSPVPFKAGAVLRFTQNT